MTIQSWKNDEAKAVFTGHRVRAVPADLAKAARRRLERLDAAARVEDLRVPPSHRLHKLEGEGDVWSISVNMQYRITFVWGPNGPQDVWFGDYH